MASTLPQFEAGYEAIDIFELVVNVVFCLEVLLRLLCAPFPSKLFRDMYMWMDVLAVVPFLSVLILQFSGLSELKDDPVVQLFTSLVPIMRLTKIARHSGSWRLLVYAVRECTLPLLVPAFLLVLIAVFSSCVLFWIEDIFREDGDSASKFESVPHTMWFTVVTLSTVGYGDVYPLTPVGKGFSCLLIMCCVGYTSMPLAIIGGQFREVWSNRERILIQDKTTKKFSDGGINRDRLEELFHAMDSDGSGRIDKSEFVALIQHFNLGLTLSQVRKLFRTIDVDSSGMVSFVEFAEFLFPEVDVEDDAAGDEPGRVTKTLSDPKRVSE